MCTPTVPCCWLHIRITVTPIAYIHGVRWRTWGAGTSCWDLGRWLGPGSLAGTWVGDVGLGGCCSVFVASIVGRRYSVGPCHAYRCCQVLWSPACTVHVVTVTVVAATSQGDDEIDSTRIMFTYWFSTARNPTPPRSEMREA